MSIAPSTYPYSRSAGVCAATGRAFAPGERYYGTLVENAAGTLERRDYSKEAWDAGQRPHAPERLFAAWRAAFHEHTPDKQPLLGDDELLDLWEQLAAADQPRQIAFRYVLTLLLARRRLLRVTGSHPRRGDTPAALLVLRKGDDQNRPLEVIDPLLDEAAVAEVIDQLGQVLPGTDPKN
ncbi:MAG: hypothetical protein JSR77_03035 [Planctomycetes bacterium]|nr:hypothetical protein [Planctomycetota bacterium]